MSEALPGSHTEKKQLESTLKELASEFSYQGTNNIICLLAHFSPSFIGT